MNAHGSRIIGVFTLVFVLFFGVVNAQDEVDPVELDRAFAGLYDAGGASQAARDFITGYIDQGTGRYRIRVDGERRLLAILESTTTSASSKTFAAEQLYRLCDEDTIFALKNLLLRSDTSDLARRGLELIDHPGAEAALLDTMERARGSILLGIIESLGVKGDPAAAATLRRTAKAGSSEVCIAALESLGQIPGADAMFAIEWCRRNLTRPMRPYALKAYINCGWLSLEQGDFGTAMDIFDSLMIQVETIEVRAEGLRGLIRAERDGAIPTIIEGLTSDVPALQAVAAEEAGKVKGSGATAAFVQAYPDLRPENQIILLAAFAERGDPAVLPTVVLAMRSRLPEIRRAAILAAGSFNHVDTLQPLLKAAASTDVEEQRLAREALSALSGTRLNDALVKAALNADNAVRFEAVKAIAARKTSSALPVLLRIAERDVADIRLEALKALGTVGTTKELPFLVEMHLDRWDDRSREEIASAIVTIALRSPPGKARTVAVTSVLSKSPSPDSISTSLVKILGAVQDDSSLGVLGNHARKGSDGSHAAALRVLAEWPNDKPIDTLQRIASSAKDPVQRSVAFEGYLRKIQLAGADRDVDLTVRYYQTAAKIAKTPAEKRAVIQALSTFDHVEGLKVLKMYLDDPEVSEDAGRVRDMLAQGV